MILSGVASLIAMSRVGIYTFWTSLEGMVPRVLVIEIVPVLFLLALTLVLTIQAARRCNTWKRPSARCLTLRSISMRSARPS